MVPTAKPLAPEFSLISTLYSSAVATRDPTVVPSPGDRVTLSGVADVPIPRSPVTLSEFAVSDAVGVCVTVPAPPAKMYAAPVGLLIVPLRITDPLDLILSDPTALPPKLTPKGLSALTVVVRRRKAAVG